MTREIEMQEMDWAAFPKPSEEMQSRWLLQPSTMLKKKTNARKKAYAWSLVVLTGVLAVLGFSMMMIRALTHRHHHQQQQTPEIYSSALHAGLKFFNRRASVLGTCPTETTLRGEGILVSKTGSIRGAPTETCLEVITMVVTQ
ncbi:Endoglucanase 25 [Raphanus sativus]|nr:Endoglucanase 25 [Raphanus sativus]